MKIIGFQSGHDVSYCVLENGVPVIHEELERFTREKEPLGDGLEMFFERMPDEEAKSFKYFTHGNPFNRIGAKYGPVCGKEEPFNKMNQIIKDNDGEYFIIGHHQTHAANAFFSSNFDEALIITIDGSGTEKVNWQDHHRESHELGPVDTPDGILHSAFTFWEGKGNKIKPIKRINMFECTLGSPYKVFTREIFKLSDGHPHGFQGGTVMAMASTGDF